MGPVAGRLEPVSCLIGNDDERMGLHPNGPPGRRRAVEAPETTLLTQTRTSDTVGTTLPDGAGTAFLSGPTSSTEAIGATGAQAPTRRSLREAEAAARTTSSSFRRRTAVEPGVRRVGSSQHAAVRVASTAGAVAAPARSASAKRRRLLPVVVMTLTAGLLSTQVLPALAAQQTVDQAEASSPAAIEAKNLRSTDGQSISVSEAAALADTSRDGYTATSPEVLAAAKQAAAAAAAATAAASASAEAATQVQTARAQTAASYATYTGPTASELAASPTYPSFSLAQVAAVGQQYLGTPYVYGGATPAGFDCSGFVMYVYAQFGISLAHSVPLQDAAGTTIPESQAQPGDVVIFNNEAHDGIYMGNGMIMDAPKPGGVVSIRQIWTSDYHIVRFGI